MSGDTVTVQKMKSAMEKIERRTAMVVEAMRDFKALGEDVMDEARAKSHNVRLSKTEQADMLGISRSHLYKIGLDGCKTYGDLFVAVRDKRPDLLPTLKENFNTYLIEQDKG